MSVSLPGRRPANPFVPRPAWCRLCGHTIPVPGHCPDHRPTEHAQDKEER